MPYKSKADKAARDKAYREANKERLQEWHRQYHADNRDVRLAQNKEWRQSNREYVADRAKRLREADPEGQRAKSRKALYGISREEYEQKYENQGGLCAICGSAEAVLEVDHCHDTGAIRGLLCGFCNRGIGNFKDNACRLRNAAAYLDYHSLDEGQECCWNGPPRVSTEKQ